MSAICDAHNQKVDVELLYNSVHRKFNQLEIRCGRENQHPAEWAPGWAARENRKETLLWPIEWGSICCSSVRSTTPSHSKTFGNPFEPFIKWEVYFSKDLCRSSLLCCRYDSACIHMCLYSWSWLYNIRIQVDLNNAVVWMDSILPPITNSSNLSSKPFPNIPVISPTIGIIVTLIFYNSFNLLRRSKCFSFFLCSIFVCWQRER